MSSAADVCTPGVAWTPATWNGVWQSPSSMEWAVILGGFIMCAMAFGIGANDSANSWATSVGSRAIRMRTALAIGGAMEFLGATTLGYGVSTTIQKGVSELTNPYCWACGFCDSKMALFMVAMLAALVGAAGFLLLATFSSMPVSTTHSIVGAVVGATVVGTSFSCLNWSWNNGLAAIIASWFISPLLAGAIGVAVYLATYHVIVKNEKLAAARAVTALPILYGATTGALSVLVLIKAKPLKKLDIGIKFAIAVALGTATGVAARLVLVPIVRRKLRERESVTAAELAEIGGHAAPLVKTTTTTTTTNTAVTGADSDATQRTRTTAAAATATTATATDDHAKGAKVGSVDDIGEIHTDAMQLTAGVKDVVETKKTDAVPDDDAAFASSDEPLNAGVFVFRYLIVFVAAWESFAHGANDTANATGAFAALYDTYIAGFSETACDSQATPVWVMALAGLFVFIGMQVLGARVIRTVGENIAAVNYHTGFCIELASMITVVIASFIGLPVSSTHCQVGAVVFVGMAKHGAKNVNWKLFLKICVSWAVTLPFAGLAAAALTGALRPTAKT